jgi:hypothetical protein
VIDATIFTGALDRADVGCLFHDADEGVIAPRIRTQRARVIFCQIATAGTGVNALGDGLQHPRQTPHLFGRPFKQEIGEPLRRFSADPRQARQLTR